MEVTIQHKFITLNDYIDQERIPYKGKFIANAIKQDETNQVVKQVKQFKYETLEGKYDVTFKWKLKSMRCDPDNIAFGQKFILDGLVRANYLKNDTFKYINSIKHEFEKDNEYKVTVCFKEVLK